MTTRHDPLTAACAAALCDAIPAALKETIRQLVQAGCGKREVMAAIAASVKRQADPGHGRLTIAAASAWCDRCLREFA